MYSALTDNKRYTVLYRQNDGVQINVKITEVDYYH